MSGEQAIAEASVAQLPRANGPPVARAWLRVTPDDFRVDEQLGFPVSGEGEHLFLRVRKERWNTEDVAKLLCREFGVRRNAVSYAGLKDRNAVATQWFSIHLPGIDRPWEPGPIAEGVELVEGIRNGRKLRRGALAGNRFRIRVDIDGGDRKAVHERLARVASSGVPNYFGAQRFGRRGDNVAQALEMFQGRRVPRHLRGLLLSAVRSHLFNAVLAERVAAGTWNGWVGGDAMMLNGSRSMFIAEPGDERIPRRLALFDIHPTGPLAGEGDALVVGEAAETEQSVLARYPELTAGLCANRLEAARRPLRLLAESLAWHELGGGRWEISFGLPAGAYATTVLREAFDLAE